MTMASAAAPTSGSSNTTPPTNQNETRPSNWKVWLLASRPHTLTASISPVLVGHSLTVALYSPNSTALSWQWLLFCILIQLGTNLHNDYADFVMGADTHERVGQARATQKGWLSPQQTCAASTTTLVLALGIGLQMIFQQEQQQDVLLWFVVLSSVFNAVAYTGGPFPLGYIGLGSVSIAYSGLGDIFCFIYFGLVATLTIPYLQVYNGNYMETFQTMRPCFGPACSVGFLATAIIVVNNLRDRHTDVVAKKQTVAVRFGGTFCRVEYVVLLLLSYMIVVVTYMKQQQEKESNIGSTWLLLPLLSIPMAISQLKAVWTKEGSDLNPHVGGTARLQLVFCILLSLGMRLASTKR